MDIDDEDDDLIGAYYRQAYQLTRDARERDRREGFSPVGPDPRVKLARRRARLGREYGGTDVARMAHEAIDDGRADPGGGPGAHERAREGRGQLNRQRRRGRAAESEAWK
jgi:hypothetical protein